MNREIKFRGRGIDDGQWVYGLLINEGKAIQTPLEMAHNPPSRLHRYKHNIDPQTVGQYTGLHDKNGTEIWEGDKLRWWVNDVVRDGIIEFMVGYFDCDFIGWDPLRGECEVIGNIHDKEDA